MKSFQNTKIAKLAAIGAAISLFSGAVGYAAGEWENIWVQFDSVNLKVNGQNVTSSNFLYNDRTYVPLRACAEMLGSTVEWSQTSNTASITANTAGSADTAKVISDMQAASELMNDFGTLFDIGNELHVDYLLCIDHYNEVFLNKWDDYYSDTIKHLNDSIELFNEKIELIENINNNSEIIGLSFPKVIEIVKNYGTAIDSLKTAYDHIDHFEQYRDEASHVEAIRLANIAYDTRSTSQKLSIEYYNMAFNYIQNYK